MSRFLAKCNNKDIARSKNCVRPDPALAHKKKKQSANVLHKQKYEMDLTEHHAERTSRSPKERNRNHTNSESKVPQ